MRVTMSYASAHGTFQKDATVTERHMRSCSNAQFNGHSITFIIDVKSEQVPCAISLGAFDAIAGERRRQRGQILSAFQTHDERISRIARNLFLRRPDSIDGIIRIWEHDVDDDLDAAPVSPLDS
ncbi:DUF1488 family protein [Acidisoma cellulosilytica]|uniref:DUF1488 family protein n=1 Tax=Acidisoma cellulosilyticum TaxID=2802395 RepID=A0A964E6C6_9PROT|nr:DUF1488 family protein [Acidisoma cellulosilyticum]MCB8883426.1 DUF1488 family protein [Acidisoma cellulosilyticum]